MHTRDHAILPYALDLLTEVPAHESDWHCTAVLLGAGRAMRRVSGAPVYNYDLADPSRRAHTEAGAESTLGAAEFRAALAEGQALDLDAAARFAVGVGRAAPHSAP
jgi:hypothetical protein